MPTRTRIIFSRIATCATVIVGFACIATIYDPPYYFGCATQKEIIKVGGCDFYGSCGVEYADGSNGLEEHPAPAQFICTNHAWVNGEGIRASVKWREMWPFLWRIFAGLPIAGVVILGIEAWRLVKRSERFFEHFENDVVPQLNDLVSAVRAIQDQRDRAERKHDR